MSISSSRSSSTNLSSIITKIALSSIGGAMMGATFAPLEIWQLAWVALVPLWYLLCRDRQSGMFIYPLCWGLICYGMSLAWLFGIHPMTWMGVPYGASLAIAIFCMAFVSMWGASLVVLWAVGLRIVSSKLTLNPFTRVLLGTTIWCILERLYSLTDLWWTSLALSQSPHNLVILHLGQLSGPTAVSGAIVAVNGAIAETLLAFTRRGKNIKQIDRWQAAFPFANGTVILFILLHLVGYTLLNRPLTQPIESALKVGIIQGNIGNEIRENRNGRDLAIERYTAGYRELADAGAEIITTPETAIPLTDRQLEQTALYQAISEKKVTALIGAFGQSGRNLTNSLFTFMGDGSIASRYDKWKLVPLGEYIPFEQYIGKFVDRLSPLDSHLQGGTFAPKITTPFGNIIASICYDSAYSEHFRRQATKGEVIFSSSNDAHYGAGMASQHHAQDLLRAVETDRWLVRATNTGYSGIIDPHGRTEWMSGLNEYATHYHQIYRQHSQTLYVRWGDWLTPLLAILGAVLWFF
jgi:apolipoprotein N-acyltransferase